MGQELDGGDIGVPEVDITEGSDVGVRGGCNDETGQGFIGVMVPVKEAEQLLVILDSISNCCCRPGDNQGRRWLWSRVWHPCNSPVSRRSESEHQMTMETASSIGVNGHGVGVELALEELDGSMCWWLDRGRKRCQHWMREVGSNCCSSWGGHGGKGGCVVGNTERPGG